MASKQPSITKRVLIKTARSFSLAILIDELSHNLGIPSTLHGAFVDATMNIVAEYGIEKLEEYAVFLLQNKKEVDFYKSKLDEVCKVDEPIDLLKDIPSGVEGVDKVDLAIHRLTDNSQKLRLYEHLWSIAILGGGGRADVPVRQVASTIAARARDVITGSDLIGKIDKQLGFWLNQPNFRDDPIYASMQGNFIHILYTFSRDFRLGRMRRNWDDHYRSYLGRVDGFYQDQPAGEADDS